MPKENTVQCSVCGEIVEKVKYCAKCGTLLGMSEEEENKQIYTLLTELKTLIDNFRFSIYNKLPREAERSFLDFRDLFEPFYNDCITTIGVVVESATSEQKLPLKMTVCSYCNNQVLNATFCAICGHQLSKTSIGLVEELYTKIYTVFENFRMFFNSIKRILTEAEASIGQEILSKFKLTYEMLKSKYNRVFTQMKVKAPPTIITKPVAKEAPVPSITSKHTIKEAPPWIIIKEAPLPSSTREEPSLISATKKPILKESLPVKPIPEQPLEERKSPSFYSRFEKSLLNYGLFYLAIAILTAGVIVTIVLAVMYNPNVGDQLLIIYSTGIVILAIGETIFVINKVRKKRTLKENSLEKKVEELLTEEEQKEMKFPLPRFTNVLIFLGIVVIYAAGVIGFGSSYSRIIFLCINFGVALLSIGLGKVNDSEMISLTGFIPPIAFVILDLTWKSGSIMDEVSIFLVFTTLIVLSTIVTIFFKKWWNVVVIVTIIPIILGIPFVSTKMAFEFIPLLLIPISLVLIVRYDKDNIPLTHKKILSILSLILPAIILAIYSFSNLNYSSDEPLWSSINLYEIIISVFIFLGISFSYQFFQEKYLKINTKKFNFYYIGQITIGIITILLVSLNLSQPESFYLNIISFVIFFIVGFLGVLSKLKPYLPMPATIISFSLAEIHALMLLFIKYAFIIPRFQIAPHYIVTIIFPLLIIICLSLNKRLNLSKVPIFTWGIISIINNVIFIFLEKANYWFVFSSLLLFLIIPFLSIEPNKGKPYYFSQGAIGILSIIMIIVYLNNSFNYIFSLIYFMLFIGLGIVSTIFQNKYSKYGVMISYSIAMAHSIFLLVRLDPSSSIGIKIIYFLITIIFTIIALVNILIAKKIDISEHIQISVIIPIVINITLFIFLQKLSTWYVLAAFLLFLVLPTLPFKPNTNVPYYIGQISLGILASLIIGYNYYQDANNFIYAIIATSTFLILGILGSIKKLQNYFKLKPTIIFFVFAEIIAILSLIMPNTTTAFQISIYFIMAISFLLLTIISLTLTRVHQTPLELYLCWLISSIINLVLIVFMRKVDNWFTFTALLIFFVMISMDIKPNTGIYRTIGQVSLGLLTTAMVLYNMNDPNNFAFNAAYFWIFLIIGFIGLLKVLEKYFKPTNTYIFLGFAEVQAIIFFAINKTSTNLETSFYFIIAIAFSIIAIITLSLTKHFINNEILSYIWMGIITINSTLIIFMRRIDNWFVFAALLLFYVVVSLDVKPNTGIHRTIGQISLGLLTSAMVLYNMNGPNNFAFNATYFWIFLIIGFIGLLKVLEKHFKPTNTYVFLGFAEVQAIIFFAINKTSTNLETSFYFIIAIAFSIIAIITLLLAKHFINNEILLFVWMGLATTNTAIICFMKRIDQRYTLAALLLMLVLTALINMPVFIQKKSFWWINSIVASLLTLTLISIFLFTGNLALFNYEALMLFILYFVINVPVFINWKKEELAIE